MIMIFWLFVVFFCALLWVFCGFLYTSNTKHDATAIRWYEYIVMGGMLILILLIEHMFEDDFE